MARVGAVLIAWVAIISGVVGLAVGGFAVAAGALLDMRAPGGRMSAEGVGGMALVIIGLLVMIIGVAQIIFGVGVWRLRRWAWYLGVGVEITTFVASVAGLFTGAFTLQSAVSLVFSGGVLLYLLSPRVRKLFDTQAHAVRNAITHGG